MSLHEFRDSLYLHYKRHWFLWDEAWESFRPVDAVSWDGSTYSVDDRTYCADPSDELFGYGTQTMKELCDMLNDLKSIEPTEFDTPEIGPLTWFRDRFVSLSPCAPTDTRSWKAMCLGKPRTCRRAPPGKSRTRRSVRI